MYVFTVPFAYNYVWAMALFALFFPFFIIVLPCSYQIFVGAYMLCSLSKKTEANKLNIRRREIYQRYFLKVIVYAILVVTNLIQFYERQYEENIEGNAEFDTLRRLDMEREIDEEILKIEQNRYLKKLPKKVIKRFSQKYPKNILIVKEFKLDFDIFLNTWKKVSDKNKGRRIDSDDVVDFFQMIGQDQNTSIHGQVNLNKKSNNKQRIAASHNAKALMQTNYLFDDRINKILGSDKLGKVFKA